nr:MAG TPA: hypothetical protein [Caudoviricetes sp.]
MSFAICVLLLLSSQIPESFSEKSIAKSSSFSY